MWCETVQWPWTMAKVIDSCITWKLSCGHVCKMIWRQWTKEAKIAIFNDATLIWRPLSNKPPRISAWTLWCQKLRSLGYISVADSILSSSANVRTFLSKSRRHQPMPSPKQILTQNGHSRSSFSVSVFCEEPLWGYIAQYNKCGLRCEGSEDIASERSKNRHFRPPHSHLTPPLQWTPTNIHIKIILLETRIPGLHFCRW